MQARVDGLTAHKHLVAPLLDGVDQVPVLGPDEDGSFILVGGIESVEHDAVEVATGRGKSH